MDSGSVRMFALMNVEQDAHRRHTHEQVRPSVAHKAERKARDGHQSELDSYVKDDMIQEDERDARGKQ